MTKLTAILALALIPGCLFMGPAITEDGSVVLEEEVSSVVLDVETGEVSIQTGDAEALEVVFTSTFTGEAPVVDVWVEEGVLHVHGDCPDGWGQCSTDFEIHVPAGVDVSGEVITGSLSGEVLGEVSVYLTTGSVYLGEVEGSVDLEVVTGDIDLHEIGGDLRADLTTGSVTATAVHGEEVSVDVVTGDLTLELSSPSHVDVEATTGAILVEVPEGDYELDLNVVTGDIHTAGVCGVDEAEASIRARTVTGTVTVLGV